MTIVITGNARADEKTRKYVKKVIGSLENYLLKQDRDQATASVVLQRVDREHGNKYEAEVTIRVGTAAYTAKDSTLNVLAALDIVHRKLMLDLKSVQ